MNRRIPAIAVGVLALCLAPGVARAQGHGGSVVGFGGLTLNGTTSQSLFGGNVTANLTRNIQVVAEAGRINDVMPATVDRLLALTPVDLRVAALYGEGGVRFVASPRSRVTPYLEATAGFARLSTRFSGVRQADPYVNAALGFFDRTSPMLGAGAGFLFGAGPVVLDVGYRYKRVLGNGTLDSVLLGSDTIEVNQVRVGVGVRF
jgi:opacity protein-like surface antigen